jgi:DNA-directed RNA polymerase subunit L
MTEAIQQQQQQGIMIPVKSTQYGGFGMTFQIRGVPIQFVNAIRRILLNEMPVVEITDVQILENTTLMPHELMRHRTEMLPVNVRPTEEDVIRDTRIELRFPGVTEPTLLTTNDFVVSGSRSDILMKGRDLGTPLYFMKLKTGEAVHLTARLTINPRASHVCVATYNIHVDEEKAALLREEHPDKATFDVFHKQRVVHRNEKGHQDWFDFTVESIGVVPARDLLREALTILRTRTIGWVKAGKENIVREQEPNVYNVVSVVEGHTIGALAQIVGYTIPDLCRVVSYCVPHPLRPDMKFRFETTKTPEEVLETIGRTIVELCDQTISSIDK